MGQAADGSPAHPSASPWTRPAGTSLPACRTTSRPAPQPGRCCQRCRMAQFRRWCWSSCSLWCYSNCWYCSCSSCSSCNHSWWCWCSCCPIRRLWWRHPGSRTFRSPGAPARRQVLPFRSLPSRLVAIHRPIAPQVQLLVLPQLQLQLEQLPQLELLQAQQLLVLLLQQLLVLQLLLQLQQLPISSLASARSRISNVSASRQASSSRSDRPVVISLTSRRYLVAGHVTVPTTS